MNKDLEPIRLDGSFDVLQVDMFGPLAVVTGSGILSPRDFGGVKPKQVLELLLIERGHRMSKDKLADSIWGESLPRNINATLETYVSVLRTRLDPERNGLSSILITEPGAYRLDAERTVVDLDRFDALVRQARQSNPSSREHLEGALSLVRGEVLEDEPYAAWVEAIREQYHRRHVEVLVELAEVCLLEHDFEAAADHAEKALSLDPFQERAYQLLMTCFYARGDQRDALAAFDRCRGHLEEELGIEPLKETHKVISEIRRQADAFTLIANLVSGAA